MNPADGSSAGFCGIKRGWYDGGGALCGCKRKCYFLLREERLNIEQLNRNLFNSENIIDYKLGKMLFNVAFLNGI